MKPTAKVPQSGHIASSAGPINGASYVDRARAFIRLNGNVGPVIRSPYVEATKNDATPDQWRAWMAYFAGIGLKTVFAEKHGVVTVPTNWPWEFDTAASAEIPPEPVSYYDGAVRHWQPNVGRVAGGMSMFKRDESREAAHVAEREAESRHETPGETLRRAAADTKPLTISPGLAQKLEAEKHRTAAAAE